MKKKKQKQPPASQSPLICALAIILLFLFTESSVRIEMAVGSVPVRVSLPADAVKP